MLCYGNTIRMLFLKSKKTSITVVNKYFINAKLEFRNEFFIQKNHFGYCSLPNFFHQLKKMQHYPEYNNIIILLNHQ